MRVFLILFNSGLLALALVLEIYSLQLAFKGSQSDEAFITPLFCHFIASAVSAYIFPKAVAPLHNGVQAKIYFFLFVIIFYLPLLGLTGLILSVPLLAARSSKPQEKNLFTNTHKIREIPFESAVTGGQPVNLHSLDDLYRSRNPDRRLQAVYATLKLQDRNAIPLLRTALSDPIDDIRLLAYALLDRKEYRLSKRIETFKQDLEKTENSGKRQLYRQIGNDYWELAHLGLVQGEAKNHVLRMAYKYIELGVEYSPEDSGLRFQYAQILLRLGKHQQAFEQFKTAEILGIEYISLMTYYAEIAFYNSRYQEVKQLMAAIELPAAYPLLTTTARFWRMRANAATPEIR